METNLLHPPCHSWASGLASATYREIPRNVSRLNPLSGVGWPEHGSALSRHDRGMPTTVARHRTAMSRSFLSRPVTLALEDGLISADTTVFDYGCGRGDDLRQLAALGISAAGWDPAHRPDAPRLNADVVNLGYVINVIEDPVERTNTLRAAWGLAKTILVVAARLVWDANGVRARPHGDGVLTATGTFQKFFSQDELRGWIDRTLGINCVAAAPGVFYVFRRPDLAQGYLARRARQHGDHSGIRVADLLYEQHRELLEPLQGFVEEHRRLPNPTELPAGGPLTAEFGSLRAAFALIRRVTGTSRWADVGLGVGRRVSERRFEMHRELLEPLIAFVTERGRLPRQGEVPHGQAIDETFGSIRAVFALIRRVTGATRWANLEARARQDFLVYLALAAFSGRPRFSELPEDLQYDARDLFGNYKAACVEADRLLFAAGNPEAVDLACRASTFGKLTAEALYAHAASVARLPAVLRVYEGCARTLTGTVDDATLLKLHRQKAQVSYLSYPTFDDDPHPALATVVIGRLGRLDVSFRDFRESPNPPVLHRKELFVPDDYPSRDKFARLTAQEERHGLLDEPVAIGTRNGWATRLSQAGLALRGHRVVPSSEPNK